jgi:serine/threonine-protein kinase HipA
MAALDIYCNATLVGTLTREAHGGVFTYLPGTESADCVSLRMPVRDGSCTWSGNIMPSFQMNLPEGYKSDLVRQKLAPHADVADFAILALTGANTIGRIRAVPRDTTLNTASSTFNMVRLLAVRDFRINLMKHLPERTAEGISGVMPKVFAFCEEAKTRTREFILKTGPADLPGLSINEYLCLEVARNTELDVPETRLSQDGQVLAIRRFDVQEDGSRLGVEDFCALKGLDPVRKYQGSAEDLAKLSATSSSELITGQTASAGCFCCCY